MNGPPTAAPGRAASRREILIAGAGAAAGAALLGCRSAADPAARGRAAQGAELDLTFAELDDQSQKVEPIRPEERAARRARLGAILAAGGLDAFFCEGGPTMTYLAGVTWGLSERPFGLVVLADGSHFWLSPAFEAGRAERAVAGEAGRRGPGGPIETWEEHEYAFVPLEAALRKRGVERLGLDPRARFFLADAMAARLGPGNVVNAARAVEELRSVKDAHEILLLRRANELTQEALRAVAKRVRPGQSGGDIAALVHAAQKRLGLRQTWVLALIGPAAAFPHGSDPSAVLSEGDMLLVDCGGTLHDYHSDETRTWVPAGAVGALESRVWHAVRDAQLRAFEAVRPGARCADVDRVARESIESAGFGSGYAALTHRLGHGIGLEGHEDPYFDGGSAILLKSGMTLSDEPGIYLPDRFGVRLEDIVAVTDEGADHFGSWQRGPSSPD